MKPQENQVLDFSKKEILVISQEVFHKPVEAKLYENLDLKPLLQPSTHLVAGTNQNTLSLDHPSEIRVCIPELGDFMPTLKSNPTLRDFQAYVSLLEQERGFSTQGPVDKCLLLGEEIGELFKSVRKMQNMGVDAKSKVDSVANELADIFIYICSIANRYEVDLEKAFFSKEEENKNRTWK